MADYKYNRYVKNVPDYVDTSKPLDSEEVAIMWEDKDLKLESPICGGEARKIVRPNDGDDWEIPWQHFMETQAMRMRNIYPTEYMALYNPREGATGEIPEPFVGLTRDMTVEEMCRTVKMDNPMEYGGILLSYVINHKDAELKEDKTSEPGTPFLNLVPDVNETITDYQKIYLRKTFQDKFANWAIRPESHMRLNLGLDPELFCSYECPNHPENGVGHLAAAMGIVTAIRQHFYRSDEVDNILFDSAYTVAGLRTVAGVHTWLSATDTIEELDIEYN